MNQTELVGIFIVIYFSIGFIEYIRLSEEFRQRLREDYPLTEYQIIEFSIVTVLLIFGCPLLIMKTLLNIKTFLVNFWRKITFPFRLRRFAKKLNKVSEEKDTKKSVGLLFDAMKEIMK